MVRRICLFLSAVLLFFVVALIFILYGMVPQLNPVAITIPMTISSPAFANNGLIPSRFTCDGANVNPALLIQDAPRGTKSLALIVSDPDAPAGTWIHWTAWNIDPKTQRIGEASVPREAVQGTTSFGAPGYGGPCPPSGTHRYVFMVYALDAKLTLPEGADVKALEQAMHGHMLDSVQTVGLYARKK